jgi:hypothetical protein
MLNQVGKRITSIIGAAVLRRNCSTHLLYGTPHALSMISSHKPLVSERTAFHRDCWIAGIPLLPDDFDQHPLPAPPVELAAEYQP